MDYSTSSMDTTMRIKEVVDAIECRKGQSYARSLMCIVNLHTAAMFTRMYTATGDAEISFDSAHPANMLAKASIKAIAATMGQFAELTYPIIEGREDLAMGQRINFLRDMRTDLDIIQNHIFDPERFER